MSLTTVIDRKEVVVDNRIDSVLFSQEQIEQRVIELAADLNEKYADAKRQLVIVGVLKGCFIFMADLVRRLTVPHRVEFMGLSSYGNKTTSSGSVRIVMDLRTDVEGEDVVIVEDICDTGFTLQYLQDLLSTRKPASLTTCMFLRKKARMVAKPQVDFIGFDIPDEWVVGYGLDYAEQLRTLPYIGILKPEVYT
eukprot:TRINITY_DN113_c0_g2_i3.p1 TRINITY_DN113_c0_g2~~TRINITY_DN113_c0_g2_i3.p1  ORF type:complete len:194 (-),score=42.19 TRINITY_DN113_c0_g2_i3:90-671(-)